MLTFKYKAYFIIQTQFMFYILQQLITITTHLKMYDFNQKQRFVSTMVNGMNYFNKEVVIRHVLEFLKANQQFTPRQIVRQAPGGSFFSFIQITGFVQIDKSHIEMYIGVRDKYPMQAPAFLLTFDRQNFAVNQEAKLLQAQLISLEQNQKKQDFVMLKFPILNKEWNPRVHTIYSAFVSIMQIITRPPLVRPKFQQKLPLKSSYQNNQNGQVKIRKLNSKQINQITTKMHGDITQLMIGKQNLDQQSQALDYSECRQIFLQQHLTDLKSKLTASKLAIELQSQNLRKDLRQIEDSGKCDKLLEMDQSQKTKLNILSQQQALKQAEVKLRSKMEKDASIKFSDYKKIMKVLYEKMFDNQTMLLKQIK